MPKKSRSKKLTKKQKIQYELTRGKFSRVYILALLLLAGSLVYLSRVAYIGSDRRKFDQAETSIIKITDAISTEIAKPDDQDIQKHCSYVSRKEGNGPRSCYISATLLYTNIPDQKADNLIHNVTQIDATNGTVFSQENGAKELKSFSVANGDRSERNTTSYVETSSRMTCHISFSREQPYGTKFNISGNSGLANNLYIDISCSDYARAEHYPLN